MSLSCSVASWIVGHGFLPVPGPAGISERTFLQIRPAQFPCRAHARFIAGGAPVRPSAPPAEAVWPGLPHMQNILPFPSASPCMVTIHDVLFEAYPHFFPWFFRVRSKLLMRSAAANSAHVFTVSQYSRNEIIRRYSLAPDRITVLYNGVDSSKYVPGDGGRQEIEACGLTPGGYVLSIGRLDARKNHVSLLEAYARLKGPVPTLVIAGQHAFGHEKAYHAVQHLGLQEKVRILENVDDALLPALYRHAKLFVYPSWAEGFGMPPVEAMASGVPVICSNTTLLPEIVGGNGLLVAPGDIGELAAAMNRVLSDDALAQRLHVLGLERARSFQWETAARKLREVYVSFFGSSRRETSQC